MFIQPLHEISPYVSSDYCYSDEFELIVLFSFLPAVSPTADSLDEAVCEQVRESMSRTLGVELTQFDENDVLELKKRPDLLQRRHGKDLSGECSKSSSSNILAQRRAEFQQMVNLVHQQVPVASLEAIRYDLGWLPIPLLPFDHSLFA